MGVVRRGCHEPPGIRPFWFESSVAAYLRVTVVVCISVRIIGVFQIPRERHGQDTRRIHQNHLSGRLESDAPQHIDALTFHFLANYFHFTTVH